MLLHIGAFSASPLTVQRGDISDLRRDCHPFGLVFTPSRYPAASFNQASIYSPGTVFCVEQEKYDDNYVIISLPLAQQLTDREGEASAMEIKLTDGYSLRKARRELESVLGPEFKVQDRLLQQQVVLAENEIVLFHFPKS